MNKVKQMMKQLTERTSGNLEESGASGTIQRGSDEQDSAEGFLCPVCMTAFTAPELLAEHYENSHVEGTGEIEEILNTSFSTNLNATFVARDDVEKMEIEIVSLKKELTEAMALLSLNQSKTQLKTCETDAEEIAVLKKKIEELEEEIATKDVLHMATMAEAKRKMLEIQESRESFMQTVENYKVLERAALLNQEQMNSYKVQMEEKLAKEKARYEAELDKLKSEMKSELMKKLPEEDVSQRIKISDLEREISELKSDRKENILALTRHKELSKKRENELESDLKDLTELNEAEKNFLRNELAEIKKDCDSRDIEMKNLKEKLQQEKNKSKDLSEKNETLAAEYKKTRSQMNEILETLKEREGIIEAMEASIKQFSKNYEEKILELTMEFADESKARDATIKMAYNDLKKLFDYKENVESESPSVVDFVNLLAFAESRFESISETLEEKEADCAEHLKAMDLLEAENSAAKKSYEMAKASFDSVQKELEESDKKVKSSEDARSLLLERCLSGETEIEKLRLTVSELKRRLEDSLAGLQELGREHQSLQVKLQGRKWTDDSHVTKCMSCSKEFSITVRKHHCRVCGNIFCQECSAKTASIPSSKKPVRACDACYEEISDK